MRTWNQSEHVDLDRKGHGLARYVRLRLRRHDGGIYLDRWGIEAEKIGGIFLHRMTAPDPGQDLHNHPWWFLTIPLIGGYTEERANEICASAMAQIADCLATVNRGNREVRRPFRPRLMPLTDCHRIIGLSRRTVWTLVIHGPNVRTWGFFLQTGWVDEHTYDKTVRVDRRDLWNEAVR